MKRGAVVVEARAKLNLGLSVGPRRPDGYHDLVTVFQSISLSDILRVDPRPSGFQLEVRHRDAALRPAVRPARETIPAGPGNLVLRAARAFAARFRLEGGARFRLVKRIPAGSGLGGGSADAAAAILALRALYRPRANRQDLLDLAARIGSDVPFALVGGTAIGLGRGERLAPLALARPFRVLIAVPRWRISTPEAYRKLDAVKYGLTVWKTKLRFAQSVAHKRVSLMRALSLGNSFEAALGGRRLAFESLGRRLREAGATQVRLTGSGSAVFGILEAGVAAGKVTSRFRGTEALYLARSTRAGMTLRTLHQPGRR